jgi:hypothetical protein
MADPLVLEHVQALTDDRVHEGLVLAVGEPRRVAVRQDGDDAGLAGTVMAAITSPGSSTVSMCGVAPGRR